MEVAWPSGMPIKLLIGRLVVRVHARCIKVAYYSFQWRKSTLFQSFQKCQKGFSFGLFITLTVITNDFHPKKKYERLRMY